MFLMAQTKKIPHVNLDEAGTIAWTKSLGQVTCHLLLKVYSHGIASPVGPLLVLRGVGRNKHRRSHLSLISTARPPGSMYLKWDMVGSADNLLPGEHRGGATFNPFRLGDWLKFDYSQISLRM